MRLRRVMLPVLAGVALESTVALASPQARLVYGRVDGAGSCPDEPALRRAVAARIGYDPFFPSAPRTVVVTIGARGARLIARVQLIDDDAHAQGARELESSGSDCAGLFDTVALTVSIAIDPQALSRPTPPAPIAPPAADPSAAAPTPSAAPPPAAPVAEPDANELPEGPFTGPSEPTRADVRLGADIRATAGLAPAPTIGFGLFGGVGYGHFSIDAEAAVDLPASEVRGDGSRERAWLAAGALVPCARVAPFAFCAVATVGRFDGSASNVQNPASSAALFIGLGTRVAFDLRVSSALAFEGRVDGLVNVKPARLEVGGTSEWTASRIAGVLSAGPVLSF